MMNCYICWNDKYSFAPFSRHAFHWQGCNSENVSTSWIHFNGLAEIVRHHMPIRPRQDDRMAGRLNGRTAAQHPPELFPPLNTRTRVVALPAMRTAMHKSVSIRSLSLSSFPHPFNGIMFRNCFLFFFSFSIFIWMAEILFIYSFLHFF